MSMDKGIKYGKELRFYDKPTRELCIIACGKDGCALKYVPTIFFDKDMCIKAVIQNSDALQYVNKTIRTVDEDGKLMPIKYTTLNTNDYIEICIKAFDNSGLALRYVKDSDFFLDLVKNDHYNKLCIYAINKNSFSFSDVHKLYQTEEMCIIAVKKDYENLEYVTTQTREICLQAINNSYRAITYIWPKFQDREIKYLATQKYFKVSWLKKIE